MNFSETAIVDGTLCVLGCFSLLTWSVILLKAGEVVWHRYRNYRLLRSFEPTALHNPVVASETLAQIDADTPVGRLWQAGYQTYHRALHKTQAPTKYNPAWHELIERALKQQLQKEKARLDSGLGWLASIGTSAPFVGLFGTVWGIMHALKDISAQGNASLEVVAGPIGEALIATALGLAVAIPAVIAYNFFLRHNRRLIARLEHFATDYLLACIENDLTRLHTEIAHVHAA
ncbi:MULTISPECIES: MotA/TolQ/ExbB proton channel family protein [Methylomonas]|uniref:MotA/TolQ/ExbB proton channel family protein n=1 Tax=Methylomonas TaxID=416 RepID=UPI001231F49F|nr:MotA/TolQ/ExbB proton channel family protein [Methylomonas rhizoryzae]